MKTISSTIGVALCVWLFAGCAVDDGSANQAAHSTAASLTNTNDPDPDPGPTGGLPDATLDAVAVTPDVNCHNAVNYFENGHACDEGYTCMWRNAGRDGELVEVKHGCYIFNLRLVPCPGCLFNGTFNDEASSWRNKSGGPSCWWFDVQPSDGSGPVGQGVGMPDGAIHDTMSPANNDQASAFGTWNGPCQ
jgi:hypothetical protein